MKPVETDLEAALAELMRRPEYVSSSGPPMEDLLALAVALDAGSPLAELTPSLSAVWDAASGVGSEALDRARAKRLAERARGVWAQKEAPEPPWRIAVRWVGELAQVLAGAAEWAPVQPATVRRGEPAGSARLRFERQIGARRIALWLQPAAPAHFELGVELDQGEAAEPEVHFRASLMREERELRSDRFQNGKVFFAGLNPGEYVVRIVSHGGTLEAEVALSADR
jgi:hypothetical protein